LDQVFKGRSSPDGEFFLYHAEGPSDGPFSCIFGGAFAVSRLPWLSALTHPDTFGPAGAAVSCDALNDKDQARLWARFEEWPMYVRDEHWPRHLGPGWTALPMEQAARFGVESGSRGYLAAISELGGRRMALLAVVDAGRSKYGDRLWSVWHDSLRYFLVLPSDPGRSALAFPGVRWLRVAKAGHLLLADDQAMLKVVRLADKSDPDQSPQPVFEHSLRTLTPTPRAAPPWAKAPLSPAR
jgi:hypothetical protein